MKTETSVTVPDMLAELEKLTKNMDVPVFRRTSIKWLSRNLAIRNSDHSDFIRAMDLINTLNAMGVQNGS